MSDKISPATLKLGSLGAKETTGESASSSEGASFTDLVEKLQTFISENDTSLSSSAEQMERVSFDASTAQALLEQTQGANTTTEEAANLLALKARQQLGVDSSALASQSEKSLLDLV